MSTAGELVAKAKQQVENLTVDQVASETNSADTVIVDIREADELARTGVIPGAVHIPRGMLEFRADPTSTYHNPAMDPAKRVILHCASGGRSALAAQTLEEMGYTNVAHMDGGMTAWLEAGKATEPVKS